MFPIFKDKLSVQEICDRWASESTESCQDVLVFLVGACLRGKISWESGVPRLELLKHSFNGARKYGPRIVFATGEDAPLPRRELPDGGLEFNVDDLQRVRIIV